MASPACEAVPPKPSADRLAERIDQLEESRDDSSARLHVEIDDVKRRVDALTTLHTDTSARVTRLESSPLDVDKIRFPPRVVAAIVASVMTIIGGMYASTYGLRSDVRDLLTNQVNRDRLEEVNRKLADQQSESISKQVDVIDKRQQLQAIQIQELKEMVLKQGAGR
jgi:hypothetical protein